MEVFSQADSVLPSVSFSELSPIPVGGGGAVKEVFRLDAPAAELSPNPLGGGGAVKEVSRLDAPAAELSPNPVGGRGAVIHDF